ncbi:MAG: HDOD domain-containing protein, partial [Rhodothermales bacterium]
TGAPVAFAGLTKSGWTTCALGGEEIATADLVTLCNHVIAEGCFTTEPDLKVWEHAPSGELTFKGEKLQAFAGLPIRDDEGVTVGALCILDVKARSFGESQETILDDLVSVSGALAGGSSQGRRRSGRPESAGNLSFLLKLSRNLQAPLSEIVGFSDLVRREVVGESRRRAQTIHTHSLNVVETMRSVLDLVQLESGAYVLDPQPLELAGQVRESVESLRPNFRERGLYLKLETPEEVVDAELDRETLRHILRNIFSNAIRFTKTGGITVTVRKEGQRVALEVADTGVGISKSFLRHVYDEFAADRLVGEDGSVGRGLGLAITKRLVELSGGRIQITSALDVGTTVYVSFPIAGTVKKEGTAIAELPIRRHDVSAKPTIMLVEDNAVTRRIIERILRDEYDVVAVEEVDEAFVQAREHDLDLLLLDIALNDRRTGVEVLHGIRQMPRYVDIPAVACTAYSLPGLRDRYLEAGFNGYIAKPFRKEQLLDLLREVLEAGTERVPGRVHEQVNIELPALPDTLPRLLDLLNSEEAMGAEALTGVLGSDPVVSAWVLRHVNSVFYSLRGKVATVERAVTLLGAEPVGNLVVAGLLAHSFGDLEHDLAREIHERILKTTLATAAFARELAREINLANPEIAFTAGLLHEIGRLCLLKHAPEKYSRLWREGDEVEPPTIGKELLNFGVDHVAIGIQLGRKWELPEELATVIRHYDEPEKALPAHRSLALIVAASRHAALGLISEEAEDPTRFLIRLEELHDVKAPTLLALMNEKRENVRAFTEAAAQE